MYFYKLSVFGVYKKSNFPMKKFISTKLFLALQEASQTGIDGDANILKSSYDEFAILIFSDGVAFADKTAYHNTLVYTRVELAGLIKREVSKKKCSSLFG